MDQMTEDIVREELARCERGQQINQQRGTRSMKTLKQSCVLAVALSALLGAGCDQNNEANKGVDLRPWRTYCIRGVEYYNFDRSIAPAMKADGTLYTCGA